MCSCGESDTFGLNFADVTLAGDDTNYILLIAVLAADIIQVSDLIAWVQCATGNVFLCNKLAIEMNLPTVQQNFVTIITTIDDCKKNPKHKKSKQKSQKNNIE